MNRVFDLRGPVPAILLSAVTAALVFGCKPHTRDNPDVCLGDDSTDRCAAGFSCVDYRCVPNGGDSGTGGMVDTTGTGGIVGGSGGSTVATGGSAAGGKSSSGGAGGKAGVSGSGSGGKAGGAGGTPVECTETGTKICQDPGKLCLAGACVECKSDSNCKDGKPICSADHTCVSCKEANVNNACASHVGATACALTGASAGACVECDTNKDCKDPTKPLCSGTNHCVDCKAGGGDTACAAANSTLPICAMSGTQIGACVECGKDADCSADPNRPFCSPTGTCVGCDPTAMGVCAARAPNKPVCSASGACVQCVKNLDCDSKNPVCSPDNACGPCSGDSDCNGRYGPVICMPKDGHCAVDDETIYVQTSAACTDAASGGGTPMTPFCNLTMVPAAVSGTRNVIVVRGSVNSSPMPFGISGQQLWIVGQKSALIGGVNTGIRVTAGEATIRDLSISRTGGLGIQADSGAIVHLQYVTISDNPMGGILLDGADFDIQNTIVKNNGPGQLMATSWGGILTVNPSGTLTRLQNVTVQGNNGGGLSCSTAVTGTGVLALDNTNTPNQITPSCMITACPAPGPVCGAQ